MTDQLQIYNGAARILGSEAIATLSDNVESRLVFDDVWSNNAVDYCLETGYWGFATRAVKITYDPDITTAFGYTYAFSKPTDYVKLVAICLNEFWTNPLYYYADETDFWYSNVDTLYIKYISNDALYGNNMGSWPQSFANMVQAYLAKNGCMRITKSAEIQKYADDSFTKALRDARSKDNMNQPAKFMPISNWTRSRINGKLSSQWLGIFNNYGVRDY